MGTPEKNSYSFVVISITFLLISLGLTASYASSALKADLLYNDSLYIFKKQLGVCLVGFALLFFLQITPLSWLKKLTLPLLGATFALLFCIMIPGIYTKVGGASRWIRLGPIQYQPSELAKICILFFLAKNLSRPNININRLRKGMLSNGIVLGLIAGLLLLQPDFGTCVLILGVGFSLFYIKGLSKKHIAIVSVTSLLFAGIAILIKPYRIKRLIAFFDPWSHSQDSGFQIIQSYLAIQNGGLFGVGLGESKQKLFYLPEAHTDFILAVIGEELGILGILMICILLFLLVGLGLSIASGLKDNFSKLLAFGIASLIGIQSFFNIGVVLGLLPTKGIPLPFVSSGASSLITYMFLSGVLARLGQEVKIDPQESKEKNALYRNSG